MKRKRCLVAASLFISCVRCERERGERAAACCCGLATSAAATLPKKEKPVFTPHHSRRQSNARVRPLSSPGCSMPQWAMFRAPGSFTRSPGLPSSVGAVVIALHVNEVVGLEFCLQEFLDVLSLPLVEPHRLPFKPFRVAHDQHRFFTLHVLDFENVAKGRRLVVDEVLDGRVARQLSLANNELCRRVRLAARVFLDVEIAAAASALAHDGVVAVGGRVQPVARRALQRLREPGHWN